MSTEMRMRAMECAVHFYANERGGGFRVVSAFAQQVYDWAMDSKAEDEIDRLTGVLMGVIAWLDHETGTESKKSPDEILQMLRRDLAETEQ